MKIFYSGSVGSNDEIDMFIANTIPSLLQKTGHAVTTWIYNPDSTSPSEAFEDVAKQIVQADVFIGEMSRPSQTLGFELAYALNNTKPCLYLYYHNRRAQPGAMLLNSPSRLLKIHPYKEANLPKILQTFLAFSEAQQSSTRTSFMSTTKIDTFLSNESLRRGTSKGELIREILNQHIDEQ